MIDSIIKIKKNIIRLDKMFDKMNKCFIKVEKEKTKSKNDQKYPLELLTGFQLE